VVEIPGEDADIRFGRQAGVEVELPFPSIAPLHARLRRQDGRYLIEDLGSATGTSLDGSPVLPGTARPVEVGQRIALGRIVLVFEGRAEVTGSGTGDRPAESTGTIARRLVSDLFQVMNGGGGQVATLTMGEGPSRRSLVLREPDRLYLVGRAEGCDLVLDTEEVSREHAAFVRRWEGVFVSDRGSKNGVRVAGERISGERRLRDGEVVKMGSIALCLDDPEDRYLRQMEEQEAAEKPGRSAAPPTHRSGPFDLSNLDLPGGPPMPSELAPSASDVFDRPPVESPAARLTVALAAILLAAVAVLALVLMLNG
jgi:pSer/pThr/pTyr-binding forkhead associated (FHA) protein